MKGRVATASPASPYCETKVLRIGQGESFSPVHLMMIETIKEPKEKAIGTAAVSTPRRRSGAISLT